jgi:hypothetical protein
MFFLPASDSIDAQVVEDVSEGPVVTGLADFHICACIRNLCCAVSCCAMSTLACM